MELEYTDQAGVKHDLIIMTDTHQRQKYYRIVRDGIYFCDITRREDGTWEELFEGPSDRAVEYGKLIDQIIIRSQK